MNTGEKSRKPPAKFQQERTPLKKVLVVADDFAMQPIVEAIKDHGHNPIWLRSVDKVPSESALLIFCLSVVSNPGVIDKIKAKGAKFFPKGETPLRTVLAMARSALTGLAFDGEADEKRWSFGE